MTARTLARWLCTWAALTIVACVVVHEQARIDPAPMPSREAARWALAALEASRTGVAVPTAPATAKSYRAAGPIFVEAWHHGRPLARHVGPTDLVRAVRGAIAAFGAQPRLRSSEGFRAGSADATRARFTVTVTRGGGPIWLGVPFVENLGLVPLHEGISLEVDGKRAYITPDELRARGAYEGGVSTPLPDLTIGVAIRSLVDQLARELGVNASDALSRGRVRRLRASSIAADAYPRDERATADVLERAAREGAEFLLRHQQPDGKFTYVYDGRSGRPAAAGYNIPRHSGSMYFLAQMHNLHGMHEARLGAQRALRWIASGPLQRCGENGAACVAEGENAELGSSALTAIAAAEVLAGGEDGLAREMLRGLTTFIRQQQRPDGELMHLYDLRAGRPVDVQFLYYSGEAALALLKAHEVLGDPRDLAAARRLMTHLTGASWSFLGSRYYYGEEHWTCISAAEARDRVAMPDALEFCRRWAAYNRVMQYREGETPWRVRGAYGVGPVVLPRTTPVASRTEAFIGTWEMTRSAGTDDPELRAQVQDGLELLLRWRWAPGPTHLLADPAGARGGLPGSPVDLSSRNDFVQHACSAMARWARILRHGLERRAPSR